MSRAATPIAQVDLLTVQRTRDQQVAVYDVAGGLVTVKCDEHRRSLADTVGLNGSGIILLNDVVVDSDRQRNTPDDALNGALNGS